MCKFVAKFAKEKNYVWKENATWNKTLNIKITYDKIQIKINKQIKCD